MPSLKHRHVKKESLPETTILNRVTFPPSQKENPGILPPGKAAGTPEKTFAVDIPLESPPHTLRQSLLNQVDKQPQNPTLWILLGWSSADAQNAVIYFQRALELEPENPVARDGLDWAISEIGPVEAGLVEAPAIPGEIPGVVPVETKIPELAGRVARRKAPVPAIEGAVSVPTRKPGLKVRDFRWRTVSRFYHIPFFRNLSIAIIYLLLISAAEVVTVLVDPAAGIIFHATIMIGLIIHGTILQQGPFRRYLVILALAPLIRLLSLSLPLAMFDIPTMYRYMIVGIPLLMAIYFSARSVGLTANRLYFTWKGWPFQLLFGLVGLILGTTEYFILLPQALVPSTGWFDISMGVFILFVFTGFLEELIFRSLLQVTGVQLFGRTALWIISILFGILHIGYYSIFDVVFATTVGLLFGYFALKTRSLLGVSLAHGITNVTLYIILPLVMR